MSTFDGFVEEFPDIRIDSFRSHPGQRPPLKCFLSHIHSDHLQGLETLKSPFVYCSAATREILLHLEKYPHRMNLAKGILECRKQTYRHLKNILKPLPLNTPSEIELAPGNSIQVTLFDANHCAGAVMFLIQGRGKAILYTGDIRSEPWWVDALVRNPIMVPYTHGIRHLDKIYLDTTFASERHEIQSFPTKAEGLAELLTKVAEYPQDTVFHLHAWTYGYEEVWVALSNVLESRIHVDDYKRRVYGSLRVHPRDRPRNGNDGKENNTRPVETPDIFLTSEAAALCGYRCGNNEQLGCLTDDESVRLHSCEAGTECKTLKSSDVVWITPILAHSANGEDILEAGAGGGGGDLAQHELEFEDEEEVNRLLEMCFRAIKDPSTREETKKMVSEAFMSPTHKLSLDRISAALSNQELPLKDLAQILTSDINTSTWHNKESNNNQESESKKTPLRSIRFPYSRHSSYEELCHLVSVFKPKDVYPCTVDADSWSREVSMRSLFGHLCSGDVFAHDTYMATLEPVREARRRSKRPHPSESSENELRTSSQASRSSAVDPDLQLQVNPPPTSRSTDTTPRMKRRRTDGGPSIEPVEKTRSPNTVLTTATNTLSWDRRMNSMRYDTSKRSPKLLQHSVSDPTPLHLQSPKSVSLATAPRRASKKARVERLKTPPTSNDTTPSTLCKFSKTYNHQPGSTSSSKDSGVLGASSQHQPPHLPPISNRKLPNYYPPPSITKNPEGTQAHPIDLSDTSDREPDPDSDATTDGKSPTPRTKRAGPPLCRASQTNNHDGADESNDEDEQEQRQKQEQDTQITLSTSAFESQPQSQAQVEDHDDKDKRLKNRMEAYRAAKDLVESGYDSTDGFVIVSSKAGHGEEELEL